MVSFMNVISDQRPLRILSFVIYALFAVSAQFPFAAVIALMIALSVRRDAVATPYASHMDNAVRMFWYLAVLYVLTAFTGILFHTVLHGDVAAAFSSLTFRWLQVAVAVPCLWLLLSVLYRGVRGVYFLLADRPYAV